jgi:hypothetical protein
MVRQDWKDWFKSRGHQITQKEVQDNVNRYGLSKYVSIEKKDFMNWIKNPEPFDLLHVDISNNGDIIKILADAVRPHIDAGAHVIFEGGSLERDTIEWMKRYNKKRITDSGVVYVQLNEKFPSLSLIT